MRPTQSSVHVNTPLTVISLAYIQASEEFVAQRVFPVITVEKQSDVYYEFDRAGFNRLQMQKRAPGTESTGGAYKVSNEAYFCDVFALHKDIPDQIRANADSVLGPDIGATEFLSQQALLKMETDFASDFMKTGVWGKDISGVASGAVAGTSVLQWNDNASSPVENIRAAKVAIKKASGQRGNVLVLGEEVWAALVDHADLVDRIKGTASPSSPAIVLRQAMAAILELDEILVMGAIQNSADEDQTESNAFIGGKKALLVHRPARPGLMTPSAGYTFAWSGYVGGTLPVAIERFRMQPLKSDRIEIEATYDQKKTSSALGYFWDTIVA
ncbi:MAG: hypothetical protein E6Q97_19735 [Desulfurellales bacterium]|nr:MAG: hypothetical protein E6Q97_19735 [Desulfurellales bacterium]